MSGARAGDIDAAGQRIERLLDEIGAESPAVAGLAEQLVTELVALYGSGLRRLLEVTEGATADSAAVLRALADDELLAGLFVLHDLHPVDVRTRVQEALDGVRPYLGSHGGDVELLGVDDGVVRLRLSGSCDGCPSSSMTLQYAVEGAVRQAAPEVAAIQVDGAGAPGHAPTLIPVESLTSKGAGTGARHSVEEPGWGRLPVPVVGPGEVVGLDVDGTALVLCRLDDRLYAYRDRCAACGGTLQAGALHGDALTCPACARRYDVRLAGRALDGDGALDPVPLVEDTDGVRAALGAVAPQ